MIMSVLLTKESLKRRNFAPDEFFASETAAELKIINYPPKDQELGILTCLMSTADMLQSAYDFLEIEHKRRGNKTKFYIKINSAFRCLTLNRHIGSKDNSQHLQGLAADIVSSFGTPEEIMKHLHSINFLVDQCFCEGSWLHISRCLPKQVMNKDPNRMMYGYYLPDHTGERKFRSI